MGAYSSDAVFVRATPEDVIEALTRLSADPSWWPRVRARGDYGWVTVRAPVGRLTTTTFTADIGPVREWEGFTWTLRDAPLSGRAEWWIEEHKDGATVHHLLDVERGTARRMLPLSAVIRRYRVAVRGGLNGLKDAFAAGWLPPRRSRRGPVPPFTIKGHTREGSADAGPQADDRRPGLQRARARRAGAERTVEDRVPDRRRDPRRR